MELTLNKHTRQSAIHNTCAKCHINTVLPPDEVPGEVQNM